MLGTFISRLLHLTAERREGTVKQNLDRGIPKYLAPPRRHWHFGNILVFCHYLTLMSKTLIRMIIVYSAH